jgi:hypothetical protein
LRPGSSALTRLAGASGIAFEVIWGISDSMDVPEWHTTPHLLLLCYDGWPCLVNRENASRNPRLFKDGIASRESGTRDNLRPQKIVDADTGFAQDCPQRSFRHVS